MKITEEEKRTAFSMFREGKYMKDVMAKTGMSQSSAKKIKKIYEERGESVFADLDNHIPVNIYAQDPRKKRQIAKYRPWEEFQKEWNRTTRSILGIIDMPECFAEQWTEAVNRIREFYKLEKI